jgi:hypothetical protein
MDQDAATHSTTLPNRLSQRFAGFDDRVNRVHDDLNMRLPRLWWPLTVPQTRQRLGTAEHVLYAVHATIGATVVAGLTPARFRRRAGAITLVAGVVSWAIFSGAWDRRADAQAESSDRRAT